MTHTETKPEKRNRSLSVSSSHFDAPEGQFGSNENIPPNDSPSSTLPHYVIHPFDRGTKYRSGHFFYLFPLLLSCFVVDVEHNHFQWIGAYRHKHRNHDLPNDIVVSCN
ncbi:hypothetical protein JTE90_027409 [Oedothorax gibbosus]|uniref:Uncharacterized protein n=1 Tax=Oedothorax gibbosus TaxID=931172 RepID=A0AAV6W3Z2_9ARAC|nr:hypothetical protein JTE90_027409 [Oedothorax gibbosus]